MRPLSPSFSLGSCALLLAAAALPGSARAQCSVTATTGTTIVAGPPTPAVAVEGTPHGCFQAVADYGALTVSASVDLSENTSDSGVNAVAEFSDQITITAPGVPQFTPGTITAVIDTRGTPDVVQTAAGTGVAQGMSASYQLFLMKNGGTVHLLNGSRSYNSGTVPAWNTTGSVPAPGTEEVDVPFSFGVPFTLSAFFLATAGGNNTIPQGASGTLQGTAPLTFEWKGVSSIRESGSGTEHLGAATVTSCSGYDWQGNLTPTGAAEETLATGPSTRLEPGFPNPFRERTTIAYSLAVAGPVTMELFDVRGRRVQTLVSGSRPAGQHRVAWHGDDEAGRPVPGGVYFVRLVGGGRVEREKVVLLN